MPITFATNCDDLADRATALANRLEASVDDVLGLLAELDRLEADVDTAAHDAGITGMDYGDQLDALGLSAATRAREAVSRLLAAMDG